MSYRSNFLHVKTEELTTDSITVPDVVEMDEAAITALVPVQAEDITADSLTVTNAATINGTAVSVSVPIQATTEWLTVSTQTDFNNKIIRNISAVHTNNITNTSGNLNLNPTGGTISCNGKTLGNVSNITRTTGTNLNITITAPGKLDLNNVGVLRATNVQKAARTVTDANVTMTADDWFLLCDCTSNNITVTLPDPNSTGHSYEYFIKKRDVSANTVTVNTPSGIIDEVAVTSKVLAARGDYINLVNHFGNYWIKSTNV